MTDRTTPEYPAGTFGGVGAPFPNPVLPGFNPDPSVVRVDGVDACSRDERSAETRKLLELEHIVIT